MPVRYGDKRYYRCTTGNPRKGGVPCPAPRGTERTAQCTSMSGGAGRGVFSRVHKCADEGCRAKPFDASEQERTPATERLTQEFVNQVSRDSTYSDGNNLVLSVRDSVTGEFTRTWRVHARLLGKPRSIRLGSAYDISLEEAREMS